MPGTLSHRTQYDRYLGSSKKGQKDVSGNLSSTYRGMVKKYFLKRMAQLVN